MTKRDYYDILGVDRDASKDQIKQAYRRLAKEHHPDVNRDNIEESEEKFKEISEAYAILSDDQKRARYNQFGHAGLSGFSSDDIFGGIDFGGIFREFGFGNSGLGSIFESFFGGGGVGSSGRSRRGPKRGSDLRYDLGISLEDAAFGLETEIEIIKTETCQVCEGSGCKPGENKDTCSTCRGTGQIKVVRRTPFGQVVSIAACNTCYGDGKIINHPCEECDGKGRVKQNNNVELKIPKGVDDGTRLRLSGEGDAGLMGGPPGDLYVILHVKPHDIFERVGNDIICEMPMSFSQAALGDEIEVPILNGKDKIKIPAGTQTDTIFKLKGKGIPNLRGLGSGDQHIKVRVVTPTNLSVKQKELLKSFAKASGEKDNHKTFFGKILEEVKGAIS